MGRLGFISTQWSSIALWFICVNCFAGESVVDPELTLIPPGWSIAQSVKGDINGDGQEDWVSVLEKADNESGKIRYLIAALRQVDGHYRRAFVAPGVVMCSTCGGVSKPDPFDSLGINRRVIVINQSSGSRERWSSELRFRFDNGRFALIGKKEISEDQYTDRQVLKDINLSTKKGMVKIRDASGKENFFACGLPANYQRKGIEDFDYEADEVLAECIRVEEAQRKD